MKSKQLFEVGNIYITPGAENEVGGEEAVK